MLTVADGGGGLEMLTVADGGRGIRNADSC